MPTGIWHGRADEVVPINIGEFYAAQIKGAISHFPADDGHFSVVVNSYKTITEFLIAKARRETNAA